MAKGIVLFLTACVALSVAQTVLAALFFAGAIMFIAGAIFRPGETIALLAIAILGQLLFKHPLSGALIGAGLIALALLGWTRRKSQPHQPAADYMSARD